MPLSIEIVILALNEDQSPSPEQVNQLEEELKKHGKAYDFHRYDGAGHGFWYYDRPAYRPEQAMDGWQKVLPSLGSTCKLKSNRSHAPGLHGLSIPRQEV